MKMSVHTKTPANAPYFVVNPGETILDAMERHRCETGHRGQLILAGFNRPIGCVGRRAA